jgi:protein-S-isoprenylcysteine O-methyltransferase Ste14
MSAKVWLGLLIEAAIFAGLLFGSAGTLVWPPAWALLGVVSVAIFLITRMLARHDPNLLYVRMRWGLSREQLPWDRVIVILLTVVFPGWLALMGLDAVRFDWSLMPVWLQILGGIGVATAMAVIYRICEENTVLAAILRAQKERGRRLVLSGPYAMVRHPLDSAALALFISTALLLGSWFGLAGVTIIGLALVLRTLVVDRQLCLTREGYADYARRVPYRLFPGIW